MKSPAKGVRTVLEIKGIEDPGTTEVSQMEGAAPWPLICVKNCIM